MTTKALGFASDVMRKYRMGSWFRRSWYFVHVEAVSPFKYMAEPHACRGCEGWD